MHWFATRAIWWRQLQQLLANPLSYMFLLVLSVISSSMLFMPVSFYTRNICDLHTLVNGMPWLSAIFIPAIAMNSWASERELHTDETLLTLPISIADAVIGKWLGLCSYWCIALVVSLSNVIMLEQLGNPDSGLILAHYAGAMCHGFLLCAAALLASCLVNVPAIAFIIGCLFCACATYLLSHFAWFDHFNRGRLHISSFLIAASVTGAFLSLCVLCLSSKRWQRMRKNIIIKHVIICGLSILCLFNLAILGLRLTAAIDITEEQLSTLSDESLTIIAEVDQELHIHAFIQQDVPNPYHIKAEELHNILGSIDNLRNPNITIHLHQPEHALDEKGQHAIKHYGIKPKRVAIKESVGGHEQDLFLGIAIQSGNNKHTIPFFDLGMPVEFEIIRSLHTLNKKHLPRIGIVANDFPMLAHHDYRSDRMRRESPIISEWRKHFNIEETSLFSKISNPPDVLVVAMPSCLSQREMDHLLLFLAQGGKALILEDPAPMWSSIELAPSFSRTLLYQSRGLPIPVNIHKKGNMDNFYNALGIHVPSSKVVWSDDNPSHKLRNLWPPAIVWAMKNSNAICDATACTGIESLLLPFPGQLYAIPDANTQITPLISTAHNIAWGAHPLSEYITHSEGTGFRHSKPKVYNAERQAYAILAAEIKGQIASSLLNGDGATSHLIVIADTDFMHDQFHALHTKSQPDFNEDDLAIVRRLQNFDFINNCLDILAGDTSLLPIRTRQLQYRSLHFIENIQRQKERYKEQVFKTTRDNTYAEQDKARQLNDKLLEEISHRDDLNETGKEQLYQAQLESAKAALEERIIAIKTQEAEQFKDAELRYRQAINGLLDQIRFFALFIPAAILCALSFLIFIIRYYQERALIPGQRLRDDHE